MRRLLLVGLLAILAVPGIVFATGQQEEGDGDGQVVIDFMHFFIREEGGEPGFFQALDTFRETHPDIVVREDVVQHDQYHGSKFKTLAAANELPDLFMTNTMELRGTVKQNMLMDWTPVLEANPEWRDAFVPGLLNEVTVLERVWGIPRSLIANNAIYYNRDILASVGYDEFPSTWNGFMELAGELQAADYIPVAMGNKAGWVAVSNFLEVLAHRTAGHDWFYSIKNDTGAAYTDPGFVRAIQLFQEFNDAGYFNDDVNSVDQNQAASYYYNGEAAMYASGSWGVSNIVREAPEDVTAVTSVATMPTVPNGEGRAGVPTGGAGWSYTASSDVDGELQDAIVSLVQALTSPEAATVTLENNRLPPIRRSLVEYDESKISPLQKEMNQLMAEAPLVETMYAVQVNPAVAEALYRKVQEVMVGTATPEEAAQEVQATYEESFLSLE
jgi:raffinose/stachyose/melibiose transport system substrate-binding protein